MLEFTELRVLGCLVEKDLSTPEYYPMSVNSLIQACNQKTNRDPVTEFSEGDVEEALAALDRRRLVGTASGAGSRVLKYRHTLREAMDLSQPELATVAVLMLRGPQTVGEIRARSGRLHAFESLEDVERVLQQLATHEPPLVTELERQPGQKEARYGHLLSGDPVVDVPATDVPADPDRVDRLESSLNELREELNMLRTAFERFRSQFE